MKTKDIAIVAIMVAVIVLASAVSYNQEHFIQDPGQCQQIPIEHRPDNNNLQCVNQYAFRISNDGYLECVNNSNDTNNCKRFPSSECSEFVRMVNDKKVVINSQIAADTRTRRCTDCSIDSPCYQGMIQLQKNPPISTYVPITQPIELV